MKKRLIATLLILFLNGTNAFSQENEIGWYHLLEGSQTKLLDNCVDNNKVDIGYGVDEVLLVFDFKGTKGYAVDIDGRIVEIQDMGKAKKIQVAGRVVKMIEEVDVSLNKKFNENNNVWIIGFNSVNNSAKILLSSSEIVEIPKNSFIDLRDYFIKKNAGYYTIYNTQ